MSKRKYLADQLALPVSDPLAPKLNLLVKLGSLAVHTDEMNGYGFNPTNLEYRFDHAALLQSLADPEVREWVDRMTKLGYLPVKRS